MKMKNQSINQNSMNINIDKLLKNKISNDDFIEFILQINDIEFDGRRKSHFLSKIEELDKRFYHNLNLISKLNDDNNQNLIVNMIFSLNQLRIEYDFDDMIKFIMNKNDNRYRKMLYLYNEYNRNIKIKIVDYLEKKIYFNELMNDIKKEYKKIQDEFINDRDYLNKLRYEYLRKLREE